MRAVSLKGGQGREDKDILGPAVCVVLCLICVALALLGEACCG